MANGLARPYKAIMLGESSYRIMLVSMHAVYRKAVLSLSMANALGLSASLYRTLGAGS